MAFTLRAASLCKIAVLQFCGQAKKVTRQQAKGYDERLNNPHGLLGPINSH